ncbi:hypothetical protein DM272_10815, partial [Escherichia coli]|nr:hypothetical protein [Escherichia coli]
LDIYYIFTIIKPLLVIISIHSPLYNIRRKPLSTNGCFFAAIHTKKLSQITINNKYLDIYTSIYNGELYFKFYLISI